ncbi:hypothetical protein JA10_024 [Dickeya phage vB_DsoP_JA10]|uniref:Uncharacterized protein n=1 Tax=Dickeya phage vB_DsoP_JA10 TaxID=2283033 RepID=A0A384ZVV8_9CAUD|nr:hypothetical protein HOU07_gp24 [Dickeya phage vB_DsoP_JA10]AXG66377.1 hypothetical protein JA10_024 [Dickeya phage vB_DsoP_JA10]
MRTVKEINVDIKKLKAELKLAQAAQLKDKLAKAEVLLNNKGLVWNGNFWVHDKKKAQPEDKPMAKPRQFVISGGKIYLVNDSDGFVVRARQVTSVNSMGIRVAPQLVDLAAGRSLRFVDEQYVRTFFA